MSTNKDNQVMPLKPLLVPKQQKIERPSRNKNSELFSIVGCSIDVIKVKT